MSKKVTVKSKSIIAAGTLASLCLLTGFSPDVQANTVHASSQKLGLPSLKTANRYIEAPTSRSVQPVAVRTYSPVNDDFVTAASAASEQAHGLQSSSNGSAVKVDGVMVRQAGPNVPGASFQYQLHVTSMKSLQIRVEEAGSPTSDYWVLINGVKVYHRQPQPDQSGIWEGLYGVVHYTFTVPGQVLRKALRQDGNSTDKTITVTFKNGLNPGPGAQIAGVWAISNGAHGKTSQYGGTIRNPEAAIKGKGMYMQANQYGEPYAIFDFGKEVDGQVEFSVINPSGSPTLHLAYSESRQYMTSASDFSEDPAGVATETYSVKLHPGMNHFTVPVIRGGFRYLMTYLTGPGSVTLANLKVHFTADPLSKNLRGYKGSFLSSDPLLNKIWYAGAYTVQMDTIDPKTGRPYPSSPGPFSNDAQVASGKVAITDGAKRDRLDWGGDQSVEDPTMFLTTGETLPAKNSFDWLAEKPNPDGETAGVYLPFSGGSGWQYGWGEYALWWVKNYYTYYQYTGDKQFLNQWYAEMQNDLTWFNTQVQSNGLIDLKSSDSGHWGYGDTGEETYVNALYVWTLQTAAKVAKDEGDNNLANTYLARATATSKAINSLLWDAKSGAYITKVGDPSHPQDGNVMAVLAGVATGSRSQSVLKFLQTNLSSKYGPLTIDTTSGIVDQYISPFITYYQMLALMQQNQGAATQEAMSILEKTWGYMLQHGTQSTFWENLSTEGRPQLGSYTSLSHGWSTGPVSILTNQVLGVTPGTNGFSTFSVLPHPGSLQWAEGSVPTPTGSITVQWKQKTHGTPRLVLNISEAQSQKSKYTAGVPYHAGETVWCDGRAVWKDGKAVQPNVRDQNGYIEISGLSGHSMLQGSW